MAEIAKSRLIRLGISMHEPNRRKALITLRKQSADWSSPTCRIVTVVDLGASVDNSKKNDSYLLGALHGVENIWKTALQCAKDLCLLAGRSSRWILGILAIPNPESDFRVEAEMKDGKDTSAVIFDAESDGSFKNRQNGLERVLMLRMLRNEPYQEASLSSF